MAPEPGSLDRYPVSIRTKPILSWGPKIYFFWVEPFRVIILDSEADAILLNVAFLYIIDRLHRNKICNLYRLEATDVCWDNHELPAVFPR